MVLVPLVAFDEKPQLISLPGSLIRWDSGSVVLSTKICTSSESTQDYFNWVLLLVISERKELSLNCGTGKNKIWSRDIDIRAGDYVALCVNMTLTGDHTRPC